jgi:hypothetical protein
VNRSTRPQISLEPARRAALFAAASFFLWMFLAAAPLEILADTGGLAGRQGADPVADGYRVAADWRHGMAGNSPLYMPGFFALAVAAWLWGASSRTAASRLVVEGGVVLAAGHVVAWLCSDLGAASVVTACERVAGLTVVAPWPAPPSRAAGQGLYTAATWMVFVVACRRALARRSMRPLGIVPPMAILLAWVRPWTADDFVALWIARASAGDAAALGSAAAIPIVASYLVLTEWSPQWVHTHRRVRRTNGAR